MTISYNNTITTVKFKQEQIEKDRCRLKGFQYFKDWKMYFAVELMFFSFIDTHYKNRSFVPNELKL